MTVTDELIGTRIHDVMWRKRVTQTALAVRLGMTQSNLSKKIRGARPWYATEVVTVADALGVEPGELLAGGALTDR